MENRNLSGADSIGRMARFSKGRTAGIFNAVITEGIRNGRSLGNTGLLRASFEHKFRSSGVKDYRGERNKWRMEHWLEESGMILAPNFQKHRILSVRISQFPNSF